MDRKIFNAAALLLSNFVAVHTWAQNASSTPPATAKAPGDSHLSRLPDTPSPQWKFLLPPNQDAGAIPVPHVSVSQDHEYSLTELIDIAERENPETRLAWERARNAAIGEHVAANTYLPIVTAHALAGYQGVNGSNSGSGVSVHDSGNVFGGVEALSIAWLLFDFGGRKGIVNAAKKISDASNISFTGSHQQVIYLVSLAYYAYTGATLRHQTAAKALENARQVQAAAEARYRQGEGTVIETAQTRNLTAQAQLSLVNAQGSEEQAYSSLLAAMGVSPLLAIRIAPLERHLLSRDDLAPTEQVIRNALASRPDVLAAYSALQASRATVRAADVQNRPKIFLAATGAYVNGQLDITAVPSIGEQLPTFNITGNHWNGTALLGVTVPIFDAHRRANAVRQAVNDADRAQATLQQVRINAIREIVSAQTALRTSLAANEAAEALRAAAQTTYDAALDSYKQGVGTATTSIEAETGLFNAELAEDDAHISALSAAATLAFAMGQLGAAPR